MKFRMYKHPTRLLIAILTFVLGISVVAGWLYYRESQKVKIELPNHRWEQIFFKLINRTTELGGLEELRKTSLKDDDFEVRVWRGFGLGDLEGVIFKRTNNQWTAFHVKADDYAEPQQVEVKKLNLPKSGWDTFWKNATENGLLTLRDPSEINCEDDGLDGTNYVVEINRNKIYRTYQMRSGGKCNGVSQMEEIDDLIGEEFDSGQEQCKTTEWFACAKLRKTYKQNAK
ncbi:MAG TPA: hypothetical protein VK308_00285 [Pyrinomonadaceae bacterium]|nr:hypothetical protein [Pyrinomonadaceae bacterium]